MQQQGHVLHDLTVYATTSKSEWTHTDRLS